MTSLGTLLIQRLDAALGNAISRQTGLVSTARDSVHQPGETARPGTIDPSTVRHARENVDRVADQLRQGSRTGINRAVSDSPLPQDTRTSGQPAPPSSTQTILGTAARTILTLLTDYTPGSARVAGRRPLIAQPPGAQAGPQLPQGISRNLSQAIRTSGLFYESHLRGLTQGQYRLPDVMREPQARLLPQPSSGRPLHAPLPTPHQTGAINMPATTTGTPAPPPSHMDTPAPSPAHMGTPPSHPGMPAPAASTAPAIPASFTGRDDTPTSAIRSPSTPGSVSTPGSSTATQLLNAPTPGVDPATHQLVRQQLEILADKTIQWRGEAWPGAAMDWRIERQLPEQHASPSNEEAEDTPWQSSIRLELPQLGEVRATIRLNGPHVQLSLQTDQPASARLFREYAGALEQQLSDRHLKLAALHIDNMADQP